MSIIGPRLGNHRAPMSFTDEELLALGGFRNALRALREAQVDERRVVNENRSVVALRAAYMRSSTAAEAYSKALETLMAAMHEE